MEYNNRKIIILGTPKNFGLNLVIRGQLESLGFEVVDINIEEKAFYYKSYFLRLKNLFRKLILKDHQYKNLLRKRFLDEQYEEKFAHIQRADYALFIRADIFPKSIISQVKSITELTVAYQWDGLNRYPDIFSRMELFDRFFVFDPADLAIDGTLPLTNFYLDQQLTEQENGSLIIPSIDILFIGTYIEERIADIYRFFNLFKDRKELKIKAIINTHSDKLIKEIKEKCPIISTIYDGITYLENIDMVKRSNVLVDFSNYLHDGLSFRVFEAIGFKKKLITTQKSIKEYDFYQPENILIIDSTTDYDQVITFLNAPMQEISSIIKRKYSFSNWIKYVLDQKDYIPINFPIQL
ncbi:hypothetical protein K2F45_24265 [Sphingobacterium siyangense]|uniref:hypothetical protein n=1 Tax=Sphingobacterium TaxID=28453 RepID=UPI0009586ABE|nr:MULTISPECIES: hypothetical protein [Sphingobacterium]APU99191.1 hypothetical protein BV902_25105 [Sphingobacterium sp. B29]UQA74862.1 hypothetical protein K2F45_24265 [Sphingobacterium siyangense]